MPFSESLAGKSLGDYEIRRELGRGGMGVVYQALDRSLDRTIALKVLAPQAMDAEESTGRFLIEARAAAKLNHPNIVTIHAVGEQDGQHYIAMEFVRGQSLSSFIKQHGAVDVTRALGLTRQVASALDEAHRHGILHRDIKPQNIMVDAAGHVKVLDFGLAKMMESTSGLTSDGAQLGTPRYMSPEQVRGQKADARSDIYSLGVVLFELLTGRPPFEGGTPFTLMYRIAAEPFPDIARVNPSVPPAIVALLEKMVAKNPETRYQTAPAVIQAIEAVRAGRQATPPPVPTAPAKLKPPVVKKAELDDALRSEIVGLAPETPAPQPRKAPRLPGVQSIRGRRTSLLYIGLAAALVGLAALGLWRLQRESSEEEWVSLFNGTDYTGWTHVESPGVPIPWSIEAGAMVASGEKSHIRTVEVWKDFEFEMDYKVAPHSDGSVFLRGRVGIQVLDDEIFSTPTFRNAPESSRIYDGSIRHHARLVRASKPIGEWNHLRVRFVGNMLTAYLNDTLIHDNLELTVPTVPSGLAISGAVTDPGPVMLQAWEGTVWYKNIRIRPVETRPAEQPGRADWVSLFNGRDLTGWERLHVPTFTGTGKWSVEDGAMVSTGESCLLRTVDEWQDFEFQVDYMALDGAVGGIWLRGRLPYFLTGDPNGDPKTRPGAIWAQHGPLVNASKPTGEWNHLEVRLEGDVLTARLNGSLIHNRVSVQVLPQYTNPLGGIATDPGPIIFHAHLGGIYKNIRIRPIEFGGTQPSWPPARAAAPAAIVECRKIWDDAPHNGFTNLIRYKGAWFCVFREGQAHVSPDGALRVITSPDGEQWTSAARITSDSADLRDPQICVAPDGALMLSGAAAAYQPADARHQTMAYFSDDGHTWTDGVAIGERNLWLWRVTWHNNLGYGIAYSTGGGEGFIRLYTSRDGISFDTLVDRLQGGEYANESAMVFLEDDTCLCLLRRDGKTPFNTGLLGTARAPYTEWTWQDLGVKIGGPNMIRLPNGRLVAAVRLQDDEVRTGLCWVEPGTGALIEFLTLPSGGDTGYPGLVWHDDLLWVSYYSSHEGKASIYLAKVKFEADKEWILLFDGKRLTGWERLHIPTFTGTGKWSVEDGAMVSTGESCLLRTVDEWQDFEFQVDYMALDGAVGGIWLRGRLPYFPCGDPNGDPKTRPGAIWAQHGPLVNASKPTGEWNHLEVRLEGDVLTARLNGSLIHDNVSVQVLPEYTNPLGGIATDPGPIIFHGHLGGIYYKNIRIRPIDAAKSQHGKRASEPDSPGPGEVRTFAGIEFVWIPPGSFLMGSPESEEGYLDDEGPQHRATLTNGFWMGKYEVTQGQWESVMGNNPSAFKGDKYLPVEKVSWDDCQEFLGKLNADGAAQFRLPTEAEWEYACRAGTTTRFSFGDSDGELHRYGNYCDRSNTSGHEWQDKNHDDGYDKTGPVGSLKPNVWGLHGMHGNVWEWCQDWYGEYPTGSVTDPKGPASGQFRVVRGGSWFFNPSRCRSASRRSLTPDLRYIDFGFRLLRTP